jgi:hypothetical protein
MITTVLAALPVQPLPTKQWWPFTSSSDSNKAHSGLMCHPDAAGLSSMHYYMGNAGTTPYIYQYLNLFVNVVWFHERSAVLRTATIVLMYKSDYTCLQASVLLLGSRYCLHESDAQCFTSPF